MTLLGAVVSSKVAIAILDFTRKILHEKLRKVVRGTDLLAATKTIQHTRQPMSFIYFFGIGPRIGTAKFWRCRFNKAAVNCVYFDFVMQSRKVYFMLNPGCSVFVYFLYISILDNF